MGRISSPDRRLHQRPIQRLSVLLFDVQRQGGRGHQPVAAAAARHHGDTVHTVPVETASSSSSSSSSSAAAAGRRGRGGGGRRLLELLLVDLSFFRPTVLEPDLHLQQEEEENL